MPLSPEEWHGDWLAVSPPRCPWTLSSWQPYRLLGLPPLPAFQSSETLRRVSFRILGIEMAGGVLPGVATHYLIGPLVGAYLALLWSSVGALRAAR